VLGILWFGDPASPARLFFIAVIIAGVAGLKLTSS
jgi:multidrug transporter EmrE-like cation transporter